MITKEIIQAGIKQNIIRFIIDPNMNHGTVCAIGDGWFYFGGETAEGENPQDYIEHTPLDNIVNEIFDVLADFKKDEVFKDEYAYYEAFLKENLPPESPMSTVDSNNMTYRELKELFREAEKNGNHITGYIVFTEDSFIKPYNEESRTYIVSSDNKAYQSGMGGYSIFGSCLDGTDQCLRLDGLMAEERGGKNGWKVDRCYI